MEEQKTKQVPVVSIDEGSGMVKVNFPFMNRKLKFNSFVSEGHESRLNGKFGKSNSAYTTNGRNYSVVERCFKEQLNTSKQSYQTGDAIRVLVAEALRLLKLTEKGINEVDIAVTLPINQFFNIERDGTNLSYHPNKDRIEEKRTNLRVAVTPANEEIKLPSIRQIGVFPEAIPSIINECFISKGLLKSEYEYVNYVACIDVGFNTIDFCVMDIQTMSILNSYTLDESGVTFITENVSYSLQKDYGIREVPPMLLRSAIEKGVYVTDKGVEIGLKNQISAAVEKLKNRLDNTLEKHFVGSNQVQVSFITGGGASIFYPYFRAWDSKLQIPNEPVFSNVEGLAKMI